MPIKTNDNFMGFSWNCNFMWNFFMPTNCLI